MDDLTVLTLESDKIRLLDCHVVGDTKISRTTGGYGTQPKECSWLRRRRGRIVGRGQQTYSNRLTSVPKAVACSTTPLFGEWPRGCHAVREIFEYPANHAVCPPILLASRANFWSNCRPSGEHAGRLSGSSRKNGPTAASEGNSAVASPDLLRSL